MSLTYSFSLGVFLFLAQAQKSAFNSSHVSRTNSSDTSDYVGTWVAHTPKGDFKLVLSERKNFPMINGQSYNVIVGRHFYLNSSNESLSKSEDKFVLFGIPNISVANELPMTFTDEVADRTAQVKVSFVDAAKQKLHWQLVRVEERVRINPTREALPSISVPTDIILERAK